MDEAPQSTAVTKPKKTRAARNPALQELCFLDYVMGSKLADIGQARNVPHDTIITWHARLKWKDRRRKMVDSLAATHEGALLLMVQDEALGFAKDQIASIRRAQELLRKKLGEMGAETTLTAGDLKDLTHVLKLLSDAGGPLFLPKSMQGTKAARVPPLNVNVLVQGARERVNVVASTPSEKLAGILDTTKDHNG